MQDQSRAAGSSHRSLRFRRSLLAIEVALSVVLLVGAGLFLRSYQNIRATDIGVSTANTLTFRLNLPSAPQYEQPATKLALYEQLLTRLNSLPGVRGAGLATVLPGQGDGEDDGVTIAEIPHPQGSSLDVQVRFVSPDYFRNLGMSLLSGRTFTSSDRLDRGRVAIVSHAFMREFLGRRDPFGMHVNDLNNAPQGATDPKNEIVGVVSDVRSSPSSPIIPVVYFPLWTGVRDSPTVFVRTSGDPLAMANTVQKLVATVDSSVTVSDVLTYDDVAGKDAASAGFNAGLLCAFAGLSLFLAAVGLFGVLSFLVSMRTPEIGIRIALGAQREHVFRLLLADGLRPAAVGLLLGLAASAALTRVASSLLYDVRPLDPMVFLLVSVGLSTVAVLACLLPARRASRLDPVTALRFE
jgi:putative ABC transport system permease protein